MILGADLAIETGIFDFANANFMGGMPQMGPQQLKTKGKVACMNVDAFRLNLCFDSCPCRQGKSVLNWGLSLCICKVGCIGTAPGGGGGNRTRTRTNKTADDGHDAVDDNESGIPVSDPTAVNSNSKRGSSRMSAEAKARLEALDLERKCIKALNKWDRA